jgi:hypothetical protein
MAINWKKQRIHQSQSSNVLDRFVDGRIVDTAEMHDRIVIFHQLGIMFSIPQHNNHRNML